MKKYMKILYKILIYLNSFRLVLIFLQISKMKITLKVLRLPDKIFRRRPIGFKHSLRVKGVLGLICRIINQKNSL
jgi:hypothetical protein